MTRLKRILAAAAALVTAGGLALGLALQQANVADVAPLTCAEWGKIASTLPNEVDFFVALGAGYDPPPVTESGRVLGDCTGGVCSVKADGCDQGYAYSYRSSAARDGWRLFMVSAHRYIARGWRDLAAERADVRAYRSWKEVKADCLAHLSAVNCRDMLNDVNPCWVRPDGQWCRHGLLYGPGLGGVYPDGSPATCAIGVDDLPYPCGDNGRGRYWAARAVVTDLDLSEEPE